MAKPGSVVLAGLLFIAAPAYSAEESGSRERVTIYSFTGTAGPSGLVIGQNGVLYGTTARGGTGSCSGGCGTVFSLTPPAMLGGAWTETVLYSFTGTAGDGAFPEGGLVIGRNGALFGTTIFGGTAAEYSGNGTVFSLTPPAVLGGAWTENVLYSFTGKAGDGALPEAGLVIGHNGALYGTTQYGGNAGEGTVFELMPPAIPGGAWSETALYSFTGMAGDGARPVAGLVIGHNGALYGTTAFGGNGSCPSFGCGTVFSLTPPAIPGGAWSETVLHRFAPGGDGAVPSAGLVSGHDGALYGTTFSGGTSGVGTVFELMPPAIPGGAWPEKVLHTFTGTAGDGAYPQAGLVIGHNGELYGPAVYGGTSGVGIVFELTPPAIPGGTWREKVLSSFTGTAGDGAGPYAGLVIGPNGALYGTTVFGGTSGYGTVFELVATFRDVPGVSP